jgi:alanyl-tRNA synthetase
MPAADVKTSEGLRQAWIDFFAARGHTIVPSAGLIPHHPTAPMFTNSGMMQFVPYFLGEEPVPFVPPRAASIQKCVRLAGKHNDIDELGRTRRHLTFFEMLGNWSFGEYFKAEAIAWAWEFLTEVAGFDGDRIWATVHDTDDEAEAIWHEAIHLPMDRIQRMGKDNFWEMGETGPCGPSSEIHYDCGPEWGDDGGPKFGGGDRYIEFWNLVFMTDFRRNDDTLTELPAKNVDTGAGFERWLMLLQGGRTAFDIDIMQPLLEAAQSGTGCTYGRDAETDVALRILADHTRSTTFLVNDGVIPSNEDRGYVLRRVIRRAVRFAYLLGVNQPVLPGIVEACIETMSSAYPDLLANRDLIMGIVTREEESFRSTLARGVVLLDNALADGASQVPGDIAFRLHDTYGFPLEVTQEIAAERGVSVDRDGFEQLMAEQRRRAKDASKKGDLYAHLNDFQSVLEHSGPTEFVGREEFETKAMVVAVIPDAATSDGGAGTVSIFLDRSPFYAESGGQVGDTGTISTDTGVADVLDTVYALPGLSRHVATLVEGEITPGQEANAAIDVDRRDAIRRNHTGTHILHWALREVLGDHVKQQGSLVAPDRLRFDFSHYEPVTAEQLAAIEDLANREILGNEPVHHYETTKAVAEEMGAIAFFGDKYGEVVRVLEAGTHSMELCGGTHVRALGDIGPVKIVREESIGSNLRRIEAVTGTGPVERLRDQETLLDEVAHVLNVSRDEVADGARKRLDEIKALRDEVKALRRQNAAGESASLAASAVDGVVVAKVDGVDRDGLRELALAVRDQPGVRGVVLGAAPVGGGAALVATVAKDSGLHAGELIADAARAIKGGGGKDPQLAVAGGKDPDGLDEALRIAGAAAVGSAATSE